MPSTPSNLNCPFDKFLGIWILDWALLWFSQPFLIMFFSYKVRLMAVRICTESAGDPEYREMREQRLKLFFKLVNL